MNARVLSIAFALGSAAFGLGAAAAQGQEFIANSPDTIVPARYADLIGRGTKAIIVYVNACADKNWPRLHDVLTNDATIEYPLTASGTYFAVDAANIAKYCNTTGEAGHASSVRVFPTVGDSIMIVYRVAGTEHLVELQIRGDRISRLRDLTASKLAL